MKNSFCSFLKDLVRSKYTRTALTGQSRWSSSKSLPKKEAIDLISNVRKDLAPLSTIWVFAINEETTENVIR